MRIINNIWLLLSHPKIFINKLGLKRGIKKMPERVSYTPVEADIEPTTRCNLKCEMCQTTTWDRKCDDLSIEKFKAVLDQLPAIMNIKLQGMGEPLLNKDFFEMIKLAKSREISVVSVTNGSLLTERNRSNILSSGLKHIMISVDGARPETHDSIRIGSKLENLLQNIKHLVHSRKPSSDPLIEIWTVGQQKNVGELRDMVKIFSEMGVDRMTYQMTLGFWGKSEWKDNLSALRLGEKETETELKNAERLAHELGFDLRLYRLNKLEKKKGKRCWWPWWSCYISADGYVTPCCVVTDPNVFNLGNIFETPFSEIWNSGKYQELRRAIRNDDLPSFCKLCYMK